MTCVGSQSGSVHAEIVLWDPLKMNGQLKARSPSKHAGQHGLEIPKIIPTSFKASDGYDKNMKDTNILTH